MLREKESNQGRLELVNIEDLVPADYLLRKIDKYIDFSFINDMCRQIQAQRLVTRLAGKQLAARSSESLRPKEEQKPLSGTVTDASPGIFPAVFTTRSIFCKTC